MKDTNTHKALTIKTLTKHNVWDIQENDVFRIWESGKKDSDGNENLRYYADIIRCAFLLEEIKDDSPHIIAKYEKLGYKVCTIKNDEHSKTIWCIKKKPITMVTDLTYENIGHITAQKLIEVLDRNFGGGWESLSQSIQDIIESAFDISTTILPKDRLHKPGGMYEKKVADGYEVLEVSKGTWVEAIFAKAKPQAEKPRLKFNMKSDDEDIIDDDNYNNDDDYNDDIEEPSSFDDEEMNEDNYRTTFEIEETDEEEEANNISDDI